MTLREEFEHTGNWFFRWRSYLPLTVIIIYLLALRDYEYLGNNKQTENLWRVFCLIVSFIGLFIRIFTIGCLPEGTSGRNTKEQIAETLNTKGMYSIVRNPLYLGNFFMMLGVALFVHIWWLTLIFILVFLLYYERIIIAEEAYLEKKFENVYLDWVNKTPVFIPKLGQYQKMNTPFSLKKILRQEYHSFFALIFVMFVLENTCSLYVESELKFDFMWAVLLGLGFIIWAILRVLTKYTKILS